MAERSFSVFISHRLRHADNMYGELVQMLDRAVLAGSIPGWRNVSIDPERDLTAEHGRRLTKEEILELVSQRINMASCTVLIPRVAASYGQFVLDELDVSIARRTPIVAVFHPAFQRFSAQMPYGHGLIWESAWRYDSLVNALNQARARVGGR